MVAAMEAVCPDAVLISGRAGFAKVDVKTKNTNRLSWFSVTGSAHVARIISLI
jgi:hypothetical protein